MWMEFTSLSDSERASHNFNGATETAMLNEGQFGGDRLIESDHMTSRVHQRRPGISEPRRVSKKMRFSVCPLIRLSTASGWM